MSERRNALLDALGDVVAVCFALLIVVGTALAVYIAYHRIVDAPNCAEAQPGVR